MVKEVFHIDPNSLVFEYKYSYWFANWTAVPVLESKLSININDILYFNSSFIDQAFHAIPFDIEIRDVKAILKKVFDNDIYSPDYPSIGLDMGDDFCVYTDPYKSRSDPVKILVHSNKKREVFVHCFFEGEKFFVQKYCSMDEYFKSILDLRIVIMKAVVKGIKREISLRKDIDKEYFSGMLRVFRESLRESRYHSPSRKHYWSFEEEFWRFIR